eukprot:gene7789-biopygen13618
MHARSPPPRDALLSSGAVPAPDRLIRSIAGPHVAVRLPTARVAENSWSHRTLARARRICGAGHRQLLAWPARAWLGHGAGYGRVPGMVGMVRAARAARRGAGGASQARPLSRTSAIVWARGLCIPPESFALVLHVRFIRHTRAVIHITRNKLRTSFVLQPGGGGCHPRTQHCCYVRTPRPALLPKQWARGRSTAGRNRSGSCPDADRTRAARYSPNSPDLDELLCLGVGCGVTFSCPARCPSPPDIFCAFIGSLRLQSECSNGEFHFFLRRRWTRGALLRRLLLHRLPPGTMEPGAVPPEMPNTGSADSQAWPTAQPRLRGSGCARAPPRFSYAYLFLRLTVAMAAHLPSLASSSVTRFIRHTVHPSHGAGGIACRVRRRWMLVVVEMNARNNGSLCVLLCACACVLCVDCWLLGRSCAGRPHICAGCLENVYELIPLFPPGGVTKFCAGHAHGMHVAHTCTHTHAAHVRARVALRSLAVHEWCGAVLKLGQADKASGGGRVVRDG